MERLFAIPDIHGRYDLLDRLLARLANEDELDLTKDKLIFLGDMIDRGPESAAVVHRIKEIKRLNPDNVVVLAGNHEWIAIEACRSHGFSDKYLWLQNGGGPTIRSFNCDGDEMLPPQIIRWFEDLPLFHEEPGFFFSHAPVPMEDHRHKRNQGKPLTKEELIWTYFGGDSAHYAKAPGDRIGVCGHIHDLPRSMKPRFYDHYIFADAGCGCFPKAPLVAIEVITRDVIFEWPIESHSTQHSEMSP